MSKITVFLQAETRADRRGHGPIMTPVGFRINGRTWVPTLSTLVIKMGLMPIKGDTHYTMNNLRFSQS